MNAETKRCTDTLSCPAMERAVREHGPGIVGVDVTNLETGGHLYTLTTYKTSRKDRGVVMNWCPWCGGDLRPAALRDQMGDDEEQPEAARADDAKVAEAARRFVAAHQLARQLREERNTIECEGVVEWVEINEASGGRLLKPCPNPCWKDWEQVNAEGDYSLPDKEHWCAECLRRQKLEEQRREAAKKRGAFLRVLLRRVS